MHSPEIFREERTEVLHALIAAHPLATLITAGSAGLMANLIPFLLHAEGEQCVLRAHLARANKQLDALREGADALVVFQGPQCYVTPSWYASKRENGKVVPTWNYAMVQVRGKARVIDDPAWVHARVAELTCQQEQHRAHPWQVSDAPDAFIATQLKAIVGVEIPVQSMEGKWKISQNRPPADRRGVIDGLQSDGACPAMRELMQRS